MKAYLRQLATGATLVLALVSGVSADVLTDAAAAYERGDYATELRLLKPLADQGNAEAQARLGIAYDLGRGVPQDYAQALKYYHLAADQGDAGAQNNLGLIYEKMKQPQDALRIWKQYLSVATDPEKRDTAQNHIHHLSQ